MKIVKKSFLQYSFAYKNYDVSEELLQETYDKFLNNIENIDENINVLGYLILMSKNITLDYFKKNNRFVSINEEDSYTKDTYSSETYIVNKIKDILNDIEFRIFILHALDEFTFDEIRKMFKRPLGSVLWIYNNSIKKLRKELNNEANR